MFFKSIQCVGTTVLPHHFVRPPLDPPPPYGCRVPALLHVHVGVHGYATRVTSPLAILRDHPVGEPATHPCARMTWSSLSSRNSVDE